MSKEIGGDRFQEFERFLLMMFVENSTKVKLKLLHLTFDACQNSTEQYNGDICCVATVKLHKPVAISVQYIHM